PLARVVSWFGKLLDEPVPAGPVRVFERGEALPAGALVEVRRLPAVAVERRARAAAPRRLGLDRGEEPTADPPAAQGRIDPEAPDLDQPHVDDAASGGQQPVLLAER